MALTATATFRTTPELKQRVALLAKETKRSTSFYVNVNSPDVSPKENFCYNNSRSNHV